MSDANEKADLERQHYFAEKDRVANEQAIRQQAYAECLAAVRSLTPGNPHYNQGLAASVSAIRRLMQSKAADAAESE